MYPRLLIIQLLTLCNLTSMADWVPKCTGQGWNSLIVHKLFYLNENEAFASGGLGNIYHTLNNWKDFETFSTNLPATQQIEYLEMTSRTKGIVVTRGVYTLGNDSTFIYLTENGGFKWEKVFTLPIPKPSRRWDISVEDLFFQRKSSNLYILFGDIICYGSVNGRQWETVRYPYQRENYNVSFKVLTDTIWSFEFDIERPYTKNRGKSWGGLLTDPEIYYYNSGLGNSIQRIKAVDFEKIIIDEYSFKYKTWTLLNSKPGMVLDIKEVVQLSSNYLLIMYWNSADLLTKNHTVYNRDKNTWIDLDTFSNFFDLKNWTVKGNDFVTITWDGRLLETKDFGQTWQAITDNKPTRMVAADFLTFNRNMGVSLSRYSDFTFSTDSGETWRQIDYSNFLKQFNLTFPAYLSLSYDNNAEIYIIEDRTWKVIPEKDSFNLVETQFKYNDSVVLCVNISDKGQDGIFVLGILNDSLYLFKSSENGELTRLHAQKNPGQNGKRDRLLIQNKNYVVFSAGKSIFCYYKKDGKVALLTDSLFNSVHSLDFAKDEILAVGAYLETFFYDLKTNNSRSILHFKEDLMKYGAISSMASNGNGGLLLSNDKVLYKTDTDNFNTFVLDTTFKINTYNEIVRYWNGHYWASSFWNIYKNEEEKKHEIPPCLKVQNIWPNPFHEEFSVQLKVEKNTLVHFECFNSLGQLINDFEIKLNIGVYDKQVNQGSLAKGIYYLKVTSDCGNNNFKLIQY